MRELVAVALDDFQSMRDDIASLRSTLVEAIEALREELKTLTRTERDFYTVNEFARLTGWEPATVRIWCLNAKLKAKHCPRKREKREIDPRELTRVPRKL